MNPVRSVIFNIFFFAGSFFWSVVLLWALLLPPYACSIVISHVYGGYITLIEKYILGLRLELRGLENLPTDTPYIIAAKHQSAFETLKIPYMRMLRYPVIILKKELTYLPLWGWYPLRMGLVAIDRSSGMTAMNSISKGCKRAIESGRSVAIFPQGTRVAVGAQQPYKVGLAKVYRDLNVPLVPMALNSGVFWGRNSFFKKSGTVVFEFLPAIPAGLPPLQVMERIEKDIEAASNKLVLEAGKSESDIPSRNAT